MPPRRTPAAKGIRVKNKFGFWVKQAATQPAPSTPQRSPKRPIEDATAGTNNAQSAKRSKSSDANRGLRVAPIVIDDDDGDEVVLIDKQATPRPVSRNAQTTDTEPLPDAEGDDEIEHVFTFPKRHSKLFVSDNVKAESPEASPIISHFKSISLTAKEKLRDSSGSTIEYNPTTTPSRIPILSHPSQAPAMATQVSSQPGATAVPSAAFQRHGSVVLPQRTFEKAKDAQSSRSCRSSVPVDSANSIVRTGKQRPHEAHIIGRSNSIRSLNGRTQGRAPTPQPPASLEVDGRGGQTALVGTARLKNVSSRMEPVKHKASDIISGISNETHAPTTPKSKLPVPTASQTPGRALARGHTPARIRNFTRIAAKVAHKKRTGEQPQASIFKQKIRTRGVRSERLEIFWTALMQCSDAGELFRGFDRSVEDRRPWALISRHDEYTRCVEMINRKIPLEQKFDEGEGSAMLQELQNQQMLMVAGRERRTVYLTRNAQERLGI